MKEYDSATGKLLLSMIRTALQGERFRAEETIDWSSLLSFAAKHNLQHIAAAAALEDGNLPTLNPDMLLQMQKIYLQADVICRTQRFEAERLMQYFEAQELSILPIKGVCTRQRYENGALRSMGDIDFLYRPEQTKAVRSAMEALGYTDYREGRKHDSWRLAPYILAEMHREMVAAESVHSDYYRGVWSRAQRMADREFCRQMTPEDEYIFNLVHFAEHLLEGGAGIRFVMDVFVYEHTAMDRAYLTAELTRIGLLTFYENVRAIAAVWFGDPEGELTPVQQQLAAFLLDSGVFGKRDHAAALAVSGGRAASLLKICFPGYESMRSMFPWLEKAPVLLPYSWVLRAYRAARYRPDRVRHKLRQTLHGDREKGKDLGAFFNECGL